MKPWRAAATSATASGKSTRIASRNTIACSVDRSEAEDLTQEIFFDPWRNLPRFRGEASFSTWLFQATAFRRLVQTKLTDLDPPRLLYLLLFTHPTPPERLAAARATNQHPRKTPQPTSRSDPVSQFQQTATYAPSVEPATATTKRRVEPTGYTRAREYHVRSFDVEPAIAEPVSLTERSKHVDEGGKRYLSPALRKINVHRPSSRLKEEAKTTIAPPAPMRMLEFRHYTMRFRKSERLRYRFPRLVWRFLIRASG